MKPPTSKEFTHVEIKTTISFTITTLKYPEIVMTDLGTWAFQPDFLSQQTMI
jgi:hypothetical protein